MERRVQLVVGLLLLGTLLALAFPLATTLADRRTARLASERDRQMAVIAEAAASGQPVAELVDRYHDVYDEPVLVVDADGQELSLAGDLDAGAASVRGALDRKSTRQNSSHPQQSRMPSSA